MMPAIARQLFIFRQSELKSFIWSRNLSTPKALVRKAEAEP